MTVDQRNGQEPTSAKDPPSVTGSNRRTLDAIFRHPVSHNLGWSDVVALLETIGEVEERSSGEFSLRVGGAHHLMHKPNTKDLTAADVTGLRHFLASAGWPAGPAPSPALDPSAETLDLMVVMDHHQARIYHVEPLSRDGRELAIRPYDPHHFLHHPTHKDQSRERGQRASEDHGYYAQIAAALAAGGRIVVVGHGSGKSNVAHHLIEYLHKHHGETYRRIVREIVADLSSETPAQLLDLAQQALRP
ncbi:MAG TPA: hypothetical protein VM689_06340 [Aliidongia sp.]|nr:hypothetical protein [Aliidongia sp.]